MVLTLYTPADLPEMKVDTNEFIKWHEANRKRDAGGHADNFISPWLISFAYHKDRGWNSDFLKVIPNFQDILYNHLPFTDVTYVNFLEQKIHCQLHRDKTSQPIIDSQDQPNSYKAFMFYDKPLMYFQKERHIEDKIYIKHPNQLTRWFVINNYDALHASDLPTSPDRKIIMTISGILDIDKHREILKRSLEKYKDYIISF
jgi:hypothetical protein